MTIQWFPGHMAKAIRQLKEKRGAINIVLEVLDARLPISSRNPILDDIFPDKPRLILLNKTDLADPAITTKWMDYFKGKGIEAVAVNAVGGMHTRQIEKSIQRLQQQIGVVHNNQRTRLLKGMIFGIPNVGKSALINHLIGKKRTKVADKPGVTQKQHWFKVGSKVEVLDTPGILWPKFATQDIGKKLAVANCIKGTRYDLQDIAYFLCDFLRVEYPLAIATHYKVDIDQKSNCEIIEQIGQRRGAFLSGNEVDCDRVYLLILRDFRSGKLGRISLEWPDLLY